MPRMPTARVSSPLRSRSLGQLWIAAVAVGGGAITVLGAWLSWFSLFAGLQPYRGVDVLNGRLLAAGGVLSIVAGLWYAFRGGQLLRWGIGLLGFVLLAFAGWSELQLRVIYRALAADPLVVARLGPGVAIVITGALIVFTSFFLTEDGMDERERPSKESRMRVMARFALVMMMVLTATAV